MLSVRRFFFSRVVMPLEFLFVAAFFAVAVRVVPGSRPWEASLGLWLDLHPGRPSWW